LNITKERQYPETNYKVTRRVVALLLLVFMTLLRMCR
jgi:hypothetical protein